MYAVDGGYGYQQRHLASPPLSVDGERDYSRPAYSDHSNQYVDHFQQRRDNRYDEGNASSERSFSRNDDFGGQHHYRRPNELGHEGNRPNLSSPYGSEIEASYGLNNRHDGPNRYGPRHPEEMDRPSYPVMMSSQQSLTNQTPQLQQGGTNHYQPYFNSDRQWRNGPTDEAFSDQMSSTRDEVNPLDERFSEQDMNPLDERFSDIAAMNQRFGGDQYDGRNNPVGSNNWSNPAAQRRDENFTNDSIRESMLRLSVEDNRPVGSPSPYSYPRPPSAIAVQPSNMLSRRSPSITSQGLDSKWRNPDLREVIDYLNHQNDAIKANAAAYLQHLCYMDDNIKAQTRVLRGIPALVDLVSNPLPEVHRAACGALRNLSYGRANDENKMEIKSAGGIAALVRLLRKTGDNDIREVITGILWNLSSCVELKKPIIDEGVKSIVDVIIVPTMSWDKMRGPNEMSSAGAYRSTVFRNASGVLRNVSSDGDYARKKLRECEGLVGSTISIVNSAITSNDLDNKSVENCICLLRNLSYACQEIVDVDYLKKRSMPVSKSNDDSVSCFGGKNKKKGAGKDVKTNQNGAYKGPSPQSLPTRGMELLWHSDIVRLYLRLLQESSNPETLEAAAGAIQNLTACDWQPSVDIRYAVRVDKGIPIIVDLIKLSSDKVVCAAATTLRNLALDEKNKELIGKYIMHDMVSKLPSHERPTELALSNETIAAMEATLYEVIKTSPEFAKLLMQEGGIERLMHIVRSPLGIYNGKVVRYASQLLQKMWSFTEFHEEYKRKGWKQSDFMSTPGKSQLSSAENTINRPHMAQSGIAAPGYNDKTMVIDRRPQQQRQYDSPTTVPEVAFSPSRSNDGRDPYYSQNRTMDDIPLGRMDRPSNSSRDILYNSNDHNIQDSLSYPVGYDLPAYRAEPPNYSDSVGGHGASVSHLNRYNGSLEDSYGSQMMHSQANPTAAGHGGHSGNAYEGQSQELSFRGGYDDYPTLPTRDHEPLYSTVSKPDRYGDLVIDGADGKTHDVDSWV